jgi:hypothetical protein
MREPRYDITARIAANATHEQFFQMFQNMLVERFGLAFHREQREVSGYELVVVKGVRSSGNPRPKLRWRVRLPVSRLRRQLLSVRRFPGVASWLLGLDYSSKPRSRSVDAHADGEVRKTPEFSDRKAGN